MDVQRRGQIVNSVTGHINSESQLEYTSDIGKVTQRFDTPGQHLIAELAQGTLKINQDPRQGNATAELFWGDQSQGPVAVQQGEHCYQVQIGQQIHHIPIAVES